MSTISVIVPVYNAAKQLEQCLDSIVRQTFNDWSAICIDDGSSDGSSEILDRYAAKDSRFTVIHKKNEGVSSARNCAMKYATGNYITYLDSDDFLHPQTFDICHNIITDCRPDIIAYTYNRTYRTKNIVRHAFGLKDKKKTHFKKYDTDKIQYLLTDDIYRYATEYSHPDLAKDDRKWAVKHCQPWRCMYRREIVETINFIPGIIYEDFPWWGQVLTKVKKAAILNLPLYFYYPNRFSYIFTAQQQYRIDSLRKAIEASEKFYEEHASEYQHRMWRQNFLTPFKIKLANKTKRL